MKCAYTAGILDAMMDNSVTFDYCIGVSPVRQRCFFIDGQRGRNIRFTQNILMRRATLAFLLLKTVIFSGSIYIWNADQFGGADPLDFDAFMKSPMEYWLVATDAQTGKPTYFSKKDTCIRMIIVM